MIEVLVLKDILKNDTKNYKILENTIKTALLDPIENLRRDAINFIKKRYGGFIRSCYIGDGQILLKIGYNNEKTKIAYVCDIPSTYVGKPRTAYPFEIPL